MSKKKLYEVERFSKLIIERLASSPYKDSTTVIDIGAGQGYLTHRLTTQHPCVAVDFDTIQTVGSTARGNDIRKGKFKDSRIDMKLKSKPQPRKPITYKTAHMNQDTLISLVKDLESDPECESKDFCLVGLHACGDLSATAMLTTFRDCESVKTIAVVPCCFNLLTTECETVHGSNQTHFGFPISKHIQSLSTIHSLSLPHTARNLACQNFDSFSAGTIESSLHNHYKRALLSALLAHYNLEAETQEPERGPSTFASGAEEGQPTAELCSSNIEKKYHKFRLNKLSPEALKGPFVPYAVEAVACLGLAGKLSREQIEEFATLERYKNAEREVFVVHCVRSLLARVVESLLLMDRYLFLSEMGKDIRFEMRNLFDIGESPRNMVFIAEKIK
ncbi:hypothetical protein BCR33DRAFT_475038 [Rhizoclosmatium globosum]|uniref:Methyltransferase domain-containing protein n=1 Tax=Rhizoclosmatium globosum TaxID=329046 RepID=A0A1Y2BPY9_9FUNG|nr:hypothetical protein BCR33DRAFT_475038 [Rhizoclosmatium globosum]|eukprot:ORY36677.1 hypothetical protein BCR33DRAFT_475038 [Rhizoclosmatium globosum]